jgi:hypothetical protein
MPDKAKDVSENSSTPSALEGAIASSPEVQQEAQQQAQEAQSPTAEQGVVQEQAEVQEEEGRIPYSRFKEKVDEANWLKQQLELRLQQEQAQRQFQQPTQNPYAGMTPEEERFWRAVDERARKIAQEETKQISPMLEAGVRELTNMKVQQFRQTHPDIKTNSPEEMEIAQRIKQGYTPEDAYWSVMGPRGIRVAEEKGKQQAKQQIAAKKAANVETSSGVPTQAQVKSTPTKKSFREDFLRNFQLAEEGKL